MKSSMNCMLSVSSLRHSKPCWGSPTTRYVFSLAIICDTLWFMTLYLAVRPPCSQALGRKMADQISLMRAWMMKMAVCIPQLK